MTRSLGIEEQFYFILPFILLLASRRRWSAKTVIWTLSLLSLVASIILTPVNVKNAFYLLHTRARELGAGVLLALYLPQPVGGKAANSLTLSGLLLLILPAMLLEKGNSFPGFSLAAGTGRGAAAGGARLHQPLAAGKPPNALYR